MMLNLRHEVQGVKINHIGGKVTGFWKAMNDQHLKVIPGYEEV